MIIQSALASCMMFTDGMTEESYASWAKARLLAECLNDTECQLDSLLVLWAHQYGFQAMLKRRSGLIDAAMSPRTVAIVARSQWPITCAG